MKWVIHEAATLLPEWEDFDDSLSKYGHSYQVYHQGEPIPDGDIVRCPVYDAIKYNDHRGMFCNLNELHACHSYNVLNKYLGRAWIDVRMESLRLFPSWFMTTYFMDNKAFIKPAEFGKIGGAHVLEPKEIDYYINKYHIPDDTYMILAEVIDIDVEYRAIVINGKPITASQYKYQGKMDEKILHPLIEEDVLGYAQDILDDVKFVSDTFVLDVGLTESGFVVVEMNSFS
ncbi:MAG: ATP-grasp domain-containing protein, partial [Melioribacteraceae bacterium]|nr:ATP-grasp domain-containing protein [Melioribacteraceae bacterium]